MLSVESVLVGFNSGPHDGVLVVRFSRTLVLDIISASLLCLARQQIHIRASLYGNSLEEFHTIFFEAEVCEVTGTAILALIKCSIGSTGSVCFRLSSWGGVKLTRGAGF